MTESLEELAVSRGHEDVVTLKKHVPWLFRLGSNREIRRLLDHLHEDELVLSATTGRYAGGRGLIALTDSRIIVTFDGYVRSASEDFPLEHVTSVEWNKKFVRGRIVIFSAGNEVELKNVYHGGRELVLKARTSMRKVKNQVEQRQKEQVLFGVHEQQRPMMGSGVAPVPVPHQAPSNPPAAPVTRSNQDATAQLSLLNDLLATGKIPFSDFQEARSRILNAS